MIHIALVLLALFVFWKVGGFALRLILEAFDIHPAWGCLTIVVVVVLVLIVFVNAC